MTLLLYILQCRIRFGRKMSSRPFLVRVLPPISSFKFWVHRHITGTCRHIMGKHCRTDNHYENSCKDFTPAATLAPTLSTCILIGQKIFKLIWLAYKEKQVRKMYGIERVGTKHSKVLQNGTADGPLATLVECSSKKLQCVCLGQPLKDR